MQPLPASRLSAAGLARQITFWENGGKSRAVTASSQWEGPELESMSSTQKKRGRRIVGQLFNFTDKGEREVAWTGVNAIAGARRRRHDREFKKP